MNESNIKRHNVRVLGYSEISDWEIELFKICAEWFFDIFSMQNFHVTFEDDSGNIIPAQAHRDSNNVVNKLLKLMKELFEGVYVRVYKLHIDPTRIDEFEWEQIFFDTGSRVYVLRFYQQG